MDIAPFEFEKISLDDARLRVCWRRFDQRDSQGGSWRPPAAGGHLPGYLMVSTAPENIEEAQLPTAEALAGAMRGIDAIAQDLHRIQKDPTISEPAEIVLAVHGYNTAIGGVRAWYGDIYRYVAEDDPRIRQRRNLVFVGYRWSSERMSLRPGALWKNVRALPVVPQAVLGIGLAIILLYWSWTLLHGPLGWLGIWQNLLVQGVFSLAIASTMVMLTLLILRLTVYFQDVYRAINFGVPDLTELIRQIDKAVIDLRVDELQATYGPSEALRKARHSPQKAPQKIQLNFIGHSMGGLVITHVVRILSDVFDTRSIGKAPTPEIGHTLSLGRLILAAPDIPILSIISSRANGLASSLRRFKEAYLFSNEGDLALRLASTTANYISFPSGKQPHGHRLGSIALTHRIYDKSTPKTGFFRRSKLHKGIINLSALRAYYAPAINLGKAVASDPNSILRCLFITHSSGKGDGYLSLAKLFEIKQKETPATLADLFTFFDCTDYKDFCISFESDRGKRSRSKTEIGLLTRAKEKRNITLWDYIELAFDSMVGRRDVHGGYFHGEYSRQIIYQLAFLGFEAVLQGIAEDMQTENEQSGKKAQADVTESSLSNLTNLTKEQALTLLDQRCRDKGIQVYLSPLRYRVDVQGEDFVKARGDLIQAMRSSQLLADGRVVNPEVIDAQSKFPADQRRRQRGS
ncbi:MAG: alpha/beta hydrolase [Phormidesmis sp.]